MYLVYTSAIENIAHESCFRNVLTYLKMIALSAINIVRVRNKKEREIEFGKDVHVVFIIKLKISLVNQSFEFFCVTSI